MTNTNEFWRDSEPDGVSEMLNGLPEVDPPSTLVSDVMSEIADRAQTHQPPAIFTMRGRTMAKKVLWIVAAAAAVVLVALRLAGYPPVEKGTEATIGAAQRYQAPQISSADVKTEDAQLQEFLQSDLFHQLATDKAAQQALKNKDFQAALSDVAIRAALAAPDLRAAIADAAANVAANVRVGVANNAAAGVRADVVHNARLDAVLQSSAALRAALAAPGVAEAIAKSSLAAALAQPNISLALSRDAAVNAVMQAAASSLDAAGAQRKEAASDAAPR